jgi:hypothetical protein
MQSVEPVLENAIKTLQKVVDVRGMGKKWDTWELRSCFKIEALFVDCIQKMKLEKERGSWFKRVPSIYLRTNLKIKKYSLFSFPLFLINLFITFYK